MSPVPGFRSHYGRYTAEKKCQKPFPQTLGVVSGPNQALEPTPYSLRFASASGRGSPRALGGSAAGVSNMATSPKCLTVDGGLGSRDSTRRGEMVGRHDDHWHQPHTPPLPERGDHATCRCHTEPLVWNGKPLKPTLDHHHGVHTDNRPKNLQLLGPHGDARPHGPRGGANTG
jgi:hypothetical protein